MAATYNRTKVELKLAQTAEHLTAGTLIIGPKWNWNELKWEVMADFRALIIGPKWNWNLASSGRRGCCSSAYNRTKVELKLRYLSDSILTVNAYNRTKVELKRKYFCHEKRFCLRLIIGPKWNWNTPLTASRSRVLVLIIGPKWNWNHNILSCPHQLKIL